VLFLTGCVWLGLSGYAGSEDELRSVWLRFHELGLCQSLDAVFAFEPGALEVWCVVEDEKAYARLTELVEPLRSSYRISLYPTRPTVEKKSPEDRDPPPSLWNNAELREYLQDPFVKGTGGISIRSPSKPESGDADVFLKQRMTMFAEQLLDWDRRMKRFGGELPELAAVAFGSPSSAELQSRAAAVCLEHAQEVDKYADRLMESLTRALPHGVRRGRAEGAKSQPSGSSPRDNATQLSAAVRTVARRVYRFVHPMSHTVGLVDLKEPSLLDSFRTMRRLVAEFQRSVKDRRGN